MEGICGNVSNDGNLAEILAIIETFDMDKIEAVVQLPRFFGFLD